MANLREFTYTGPVPALGLKEAFDFGVQFCGHTPIIVNNYCEDKYHFTSSTVDARQMAVKPINEVVAANLKHWMDQKGLNQPALAAKSGVSQKTISNYVNPGQRAEGASGKQGSAKIYELSLLADALGVEVWQLTRQMTPKQREAYDAIEQAFQRLQTPVMTPEQAASRVVGIDGRQNKPAAHSSVRKQR